MTENYPVYMKWRRVVGYLLELCGTFPKSVRFNLCDRITNIALDVMERIVEAIYSKERRVHLQSANLSLEKLRVLLQISLDNRYMSISQYEYTNREIHEVGQMIGGWLKQCAVSAN